MRKLAVVATVAMTLMLAGCTGSATVATPRPLRLDTSPKAITRLLAAALRASGGTFSAVYRMSEPLWTGRVVFVAERSAHGQFGSLFSRSPSSAAQATSEFFYTGRGEYTCGRLRFWPRGGAEESVVAWPVRCSSPTSSQPFFTRI